MIQLRNELHNWQQLAFRLVVGYRWLSLIPPLLWASLASTNDLTLRWGTFGLALGLTGLITFTWPTARRLLQRQPWLLGIDLLLSAGLVWATGGENSPYYLYSLTPILAAARFYSVQGGLAAAGSYSLLYLMALIIPSWRPTDLALPLASAQLISFFLIGAICGYLTHLLDQLDLTHTELALKNQELSDRNHSLKFLQDLSLVLQSSIDPAELEESILRGLVQELGYHRAVIGLYEAEGDSLSSWLSLTSGSACSTPPTGLSHTEQLCLSGDLGPIGRAIKGKQAVEIMNDEPATANARLNKRLLTGRHYIVLPLLLRSQPVGVLLVDCLPAEARLSATERRSLDQLASHVGAAVGSMRQCIDRAQRTALDEERSRIASELHDQVSQMLYGLAYGLEACSQRLADRPTLQRVLENLHQTVTTAQGQVRQVIFDLHVTEVHANSFVAGLRRQLGTICPVTNVGLQIELAEDFDRWPAALRSQLYQVAQEALVNAARHAQANQIKIQLQRDETSQIQLRISDNGRGFVTEAIDQAAHWGLRTMAERIEALGGFLEISSGPANGTLIRAILPGERSD